MGGKGKSTSIDREVMGGIMEGRYGAYHARGMDKERKGNDLEKRGMKEE